VYNRVKSIQNHRFRSEAIRTLKIGIPVIIAQLLQTSMSFVDTVMAGNLSANDLAAVAVGASSAMPFIMLGMGILMAVNPVVGHYFGAGKRIEIGKTVRQSLWLSQFIAIPMFFLIRNLKPVLVLLNIDPNIIPVTIQYLNGFSWGLFPVFAYIALRFFCEGISITRPGMYIAAIGVLVNIVGNYVLMYGKLGFPQMGAMGCGYATSVVAWVMFLSFLYFTITFKPLERFEIFRHFRLPEWEYFKELLQVGIPIGISSTMEVTMFALVSLLMGSLGTNIVAGHQVALNFSALSFMVPYGLSTAITTRVGHAKGRGSDYEARYRGYTGILLCMMFMACMAIVMSTFPEFIASIYTNDKTVQKIAVGLIYMAAIFQISDGLQVSGYGALRGLKDTKVPMYVNLVAYWLVGLPAAYYLGIILHFGPRGLWVGLIAGLTIAAILHNVRFYLLTRHHKEG